MTLQDIHEMNTVTHALHAQHTAFAEFERFTCDSEELTCDAMSERYEALIMQNVLVDVIACTRVLSEARDYHVASVKLLADFTHDVREAQMSDDALTYYRFDNFDDVKRFVARCSELVLNEAA